MNRQSSIDEFLNYLEERIENEDYKNSVHKITFMTTVHVIKKIRRKMKKLILLLLFIPLVFFWARKQAN